jgi:exodeoxyribonuclease-3
LKRGRFGVKLATFNVNGIRARVTHLLEWLKREQPDIVALQELKASDKDFPIHQINDAGYGAIWHGQKSWNGVAILARGAQPAEVRRGLPDDPDESHSRYLEATVHGIRVASLYSPNGNPQPGPKFDYKLSWMDCFNAHAATFIKSKHPVALIGDYNVVPTDFDIYNPRSWRKDALLQPQVRSRYQQLLSQGWTDSIRHLFPKEPIYTFWDYFRQHWEHNSGLRIDHLLLNPALKPSLKTAGVDKWVRARPSASDHAPTWVHLKLPSHG